MGDRMCSTPGCVTAVPTHSNSGMCTAHRFWSFVERSDGCWLWTAGLDWDGYGIFTAEASRTVRAHRWAYVALVGPIPSGLHLDHLCRNRACVNPDHLEPVTSRINTLRGKTLAAANLAKSHCIHGHPLSGDNLYVRASGWRMCRECARQATARHRIRRQAS